MQVLGFACCLFVLTNIAEAVEVTPAHFETLADAIRLAEGNPNYGILSVKTTNPRKVCLNTIRNNYRRWVKAGSNGSYIAFLGAKYAPVNMGANSNDPTNLNRHWVGNVTRLFNRLLLEAKEPQIKKISSKCKLYSVKRPFKRFVKQSSKTSKKEQG